MRIKLYFLVLISLIFIYGQEEYDFKDERSTSLYLEEPPKKTLGYPSNYKQVIEYDPVSNMYFIKGKIGDKWDLDPGIPLDIDEYHQMMMKNDVRKGIRQEKEKEEEEKAKPLEAKIKVESDLFQRIFGSNEITITPRGNIEVILGLTHTRTDNPAIPVKNRRVTLFDFDENINFRIDGKIGTRFGLNLNFNTKPTFDWQNQIKLGYEGDEDQILQLIEAGNVSLPLSSALIQGSQTLFGIKTKLKFGHLSITNVISQEQGERKEIKIEGGGQYQQFEVPIDNYDENKHFFLSHYFREKYDEWLSRPPEILSEIQITKVEVWITNTSLKPQETRNVIAFTDLGEGSPYWIYNSKVSDVSPDDIPSNMANDLYIKIKEDNNVRGYYGATDALIKKYGLTEKIDFIKMENAIKLDTTEYFVNRRLGYISLRTPLQPNQALAVAFQFTYRGKVYQVGEFSTDGIVSTKALILKLLRGPSNDPSLPLWKLMMKNIYSIGGYKVKPDGFELNIYYLDREKGIWVPYIPSEPIKDKPLIQVLGLDRVDNQGRTYPDGAFDFLENITIDPERGLIIFPATEPFGSFLRKQIGNLSVANIYAFDELYTTTKVNAKNKFPEKNRFLIKGRYKSTTGNEFNLQAFSIPEGSVVVRAGSTLLKENVDYVVDYNLGRVKIINQGILESGLPITISLQSRSLFNIQQKTFLGTRFDYDFRKDIKFGGTILHYRERPLVFKVRSGDEPVANTILGIDGTYTSQAPFLDFILGKIPFIEAKGKSSIKVSGEVARFFPGHPKSISKSGVAYIDDFEGSHTYIDLKTYTVYKLASTPQHNPIYFPEGNLVKDRAININRALISWYTIDPCFLYSRLSSCTPDHIKNDKTMLSNHFMREVLQKELFPQAELSVGQPLNIPTLDITYYPYERGPYNYDVDGKSDNGVPYGYGLNPDGTLKNPEKRWAGIMRALPVTDFEANNIEYIQFWLMDPYNEDYTGNPQNAGQLLIHLGDISEDVMRDGLKFSEAALPGNPQKASDISDLDPTVSPFGRVPKTLLLVNAFDNDPTARAYQDVGYDGLNDSLERIFFNSYIKKIENLFGQSSTVYQKVIQDPSGDNYHYFRGDDYDNEQRNIIDRYMYFSQPDGNSPTDEQSKKLNKDGYPTSATTIPDGEDINRDNILTETEKYYEYVIDISPQVLNPANVGKYYISDARQAVVNTADGRTRNIWWYQFKIPIKSVKAIRGGEPDLRNMQFMRMILRGFSDKITLRFAQLNLQRSEWRIYDKSIASEGEYLASDSLTSFSISSVNLEENSARIPVNYVLPPGIEREVNIMSPNLARMNEQAMSYSICNLRDGYAVAAYKTVNLSFLNYKKMKLFAHAEATSGSPLNDGDLWIFVRFGSDFQYNYYEFSAPLKVTPPGYYDTYIEEHRQIVWPNDITIDFDKLVALKRERNQMVYEGKLSYYTSYSRQDESGKYFVIGNPTLSDISYIMIGVINPRDNGESKCAIVWINELRLTDFNEKGGWGYLASSEVNFSDLANLKASTITTTPGFSSLESRISSRVLQKTSQYDLTFSTSLQKWLPIKTQWIIPFTYAYSEKVITPYYSPDSPDLIFVDFIRNLPSEKRDSIKGIFVDRTITRGFSFTNVKKMPAKKFKLNTPLDISNFAFSISNVEKYSHNFNTLFNYEKIQKCDVNYSYSFPSITWKPFENVKFFHKKYLTFIKDFNFTLLPQTLNYTSTIDRYYLEKVLRNVYPDFIYVFPPFVNKNIKWLQTTSLRYNPFQSLMVSFNSASTSLISEIPGPTRKSYSQDKYKEWQDTVLKSFSNLGLKTNYTHTLTGTYNLPLSKIPLTAWLTASLDYTATYTWTRAPYLRDSIGHIIQNSQKQGARLNASFQKIYSSIPILNKAVQKIQMYQQKKARAKEGKDTIKKEDIPPWYYYLLKHIQIIKSFSFSYSLTKGIQLGGFNRIPYFVGTSNERDKAPSLLFVFGKQENFENKDFADFAIQNNWLVKYPYIKTPYVRTTSQNINADLSAELIPTFNVKITANRNYAYNFSEIVRWNDSTHQFLRESQMLTGNFSVSFLSIKTSFEKISNNYNIKYIQDFLNLRTIYSQKWANEYKAQTGTALYYHPDYPSYFYGFSPYSQYVVIPAFLSAISHKEINGKYLNPFYTLPQPNWTVSFSGLLNIMPFLKQILTSFNIRHAYTSTFVINSFNYDLRYVDIDKNEWSDTLDNGGNFISRIQISAFSVNENFSPLIGVDFSPKSLPSVNLEYRKGRQITYSFANHQITHTQRSEISGGLSHTIKKVKFPIKIGGNYPISDLTIKGNISMVKSITIIYRVAEGITQPTAGQTTWNWRLYSDYNLSRSLRLRLFYEHNSNDPVLSSSFYTSTSKFGISVQFTLNP